MYLFKNMLVCRQNLGLYLMYRNYWFWDYFKLVHPRSVINKNGFLADSQHKTHIQKELKSYKFWHVVDMDGTRNECWILRLSFLKRTLDSTSTPQMRHHVVLHMEQRTADNCGLPSWRMDEKLTNSRLKVIKMPQRVSNGTLWKRQYVHSFDQHRNISLLRIITVLLEVSPWKAISWKNENTMKARR
jgi:hypothetical protein